MRLWSLRWEGGSRRRGQCRNPFIISHKWRWLRKVAAGEVRRESSKLETITPSSTPILAAHHPQWWTRQVSSASRPCLPGLTLALLSCSDDKQARHMWSMCNQLANLIFLHPAGSNSRHQILTPYTDASTHPHTGSPFLFCYLLKWLWTLSAWESEGGKWNDSIAVQHAHTVRYSFWQCKEAAQLYCCDVPHRMKSSF